MSRALLALALLFGSSIPGLPLNAAVGDTIGAILFAGNQWDPNGGQADTDVGSHWDPNGLQSDTEAGSMWDPNG
jgi:hypothetical protein